VQTTRFDYEKLLNKVTWVDQPTRKHKHTRYQIIRTYQTIRQDVKESIHSYYERFIEVRDAMKSHDCSTDPRHVLQHTHAMVTTVAEREQDQVKRAREARLLHERLGMCQQRHYSAIPLARESRPWLDSLAFVNLGLHWIYCEVRRPD
jgi:hypothetical protein